MDYNITAWLQNDINLHHSSESDLSDIIYDPRYGSLFRRFINFLAKTTLCNQKYPDVFAEQERIDTTKSLEEKYQERDRMKAKLESYINDNLIIEKQLSSLKFQYKHYLSIEKIQLETNKALEQIIKRDSFKLEQVAIKLEKSYEYLNNEDLSSMYNDKEVLESIQIEEDDLIKATFISNQQLISLDEEINKLVEKINSIHDLISSKRIVLIDLIANKDSRLVLKKKGNIIEKKITIRLPNFDLTDYEIEELKKTNDNLDKQLKEMVQSTKELDKVYKDKKLAISKPYGSVVEEYFSPTVSK